MEVLLAIVGAVVLVGTPTLTFIAARKGHEASETVAGIQASTATGADQTIRKEHERNHFRWACEMAISGDSRHRAAGLAVLASMLEDESLSRADLVAAAGVLASLTADAVERVGDQTGEDVAAPGPEADPGNLPTGEAGAA